MGNDLHKQERQREVDRRRQIAESAEIDEEDAAENFLPFKRQNVQQMLKLRQTRQRSRMLQHRLHVSEMISSQRPHSSPIAL